MHEPHYNFNNFKNTCSSNKNDVFIHKQAQMDADEYFNLKTKSQLLDFISNDGLEDLRFVNQTPWRNNPDPNNPVMIDAYEFRTLAKLGYIAFMYIKKTGKWLIKSFKLSENANLVFFKAFQRMGLIEHGDNNEE